MGMTIFTVMTFTSGFVVASLDGWKLWVPFTVVAGLVTGIVGRMVGVM